MKLKIFGTGLKHGFRNFSHLITDVINFVLLLLVYITGVGIVSVISKISGKHFLDLKSKGPSWVTRKLKKRPIEEYYRMF